MYDRRMSLVVIKNSNRAASFALNNNPREKKKSLSRLSRYHPCMHIIRFNQTNLSFHTKYVYVCFLKSERKHTHTRQKNY